MSQPELIFDTSQALTKFEKQKSHITYKTKDGARVPGVTTVAKLGDDPSALLYWAWDLGKQGIDFRKARDSAADVGTLAHFMVQCHVRNQKPDLSEFTPAQVSLAENCFIKWLYFWESEKFEVIAVEQPIVSDRWRYGGTLDIIVKDANGQPALLDWKTAKSIYQSYIIQVAAYEQLWNEEKEILAEDLQIKRRAIIRIGKSEQPDLEVRWLDDMSAYWNAFKCQLELYRAFQKCPKIGD